MVALRIQATVETDGELHLGGLPLQKGQHAEIIVLTAEPGEDTDEAVLALLRADPAWAWLSDPAEDVYTEADVQ